MLGNDILYSVRYILKADNNGLVHTLTLGNVEAIAGQVVVWLRKEDEEGLQRCPDIISSSFLNGLIYEKRGKDESIPALEPGRHINNSIMLKKLRIAFSLRTDDILAILVEQRFRVSMPEITTMVRAPDRKNSRECGDQFLHYFLHGLATHQRVRKSQDGYGSYTKRGRRQIISLL